MFKFFFRKKKVEGSVKGDVEGKSYDGGDRESESIVDSTEGSSLRDGKGRSNTAGDDESWNAGSEGKNNDVGSNSYSNDSVRGNGNVFSKFIKGRSNTSQKKAFGSSTWFADRYNTIVLQRNFIILLLIGSLGCTVLSVLTVINVTKSKSIEPFIIEINKSSGITTVVDPVTVTAYSADEALLRYNIVRYIKHREFFNPFTYKYDYKTATRLMSSNDVYRGFLRFISSNNSDSPVNNFSSTIDSDFKLKSIQYLDNSKSSAQVRFHMWYKTQGGGYKAYDKIVILSYKYYNKRMSDDERQVNPLGFTVTSYRIDDEFV